MTTEIDVRGSRPSCYALLWLLLDDASRRQTRADLFALQRPDGGWAMASLGDSTWKRKDGTPQDLATCDGYGTGFCVYVWLLPHFPGCSRLWRSPTGTNQGQVFGDRLNHVPSSEAPAPSSAMQQPAALSAARRRVGQAGVNAQPSLNQTSTCWPPASSMFCRIRFIAVASASQPSW
jgi:hypothetical protein